MFLIQLCRTGLAEISPFGSLRPSSGNYFDDSLVFCLTDEQMQDVLGNDVEEYKWDAHCEFFNKEEMTKIMNYCNPQAFGNDYGE